MRQPCFSWLLSASFALAATAAQAQVTFGMGPKVGYGLASVRYCDADAPDQRVDCRSSLKTGVLAAAISPGSRPCFRHRAGFGCGKPVATPPILLMPIRTR